MQKKNWKKIQSHLSAKNIDKKNDTLKLSWRGGVNEKNSKWTSADQSTYLDFVFCLLFSEQKKIEFEQFTLMIDVNFKEKLNENLDRL